MPRFIIVRHGSNAANQSMKNRKVLGTVEAADSDTAKAFAADRWTRYNNQHFEAIDMGGRTRKADRDEAAEQDALADLQGYPIATPLTEIDQ